MNSVEQRLAQMFRTARWAYFQDKSGPMFIYNTERLCLFNENDPSHRKFESAVFVPYGQGSRSGKAEQWKELEGSRSAHDLRKDAKARALRLFEHWREHGVIDV